MEVLQSWEQKVLELCPGHWSGCGVSRFPGITPVQRRLTQGSLPKEAASGYVFEGAVGEAAEKGGSRRTTGRAASWSFIFPGSSKFQSHLWSSVHFFPSLSSHLLHLFFPVPGACLPSSWLVVLPLPCLWHHSLSEDKAFVLHPLTGCQA